MLEQQLGLHNWENSQKLQVRTLNFQQGQGHRNWFVILNWTGLLRVLHGLVAVCSVSPANNLANCVPTQAGADGSCEDKGTNPPKRSAKVTCSKFARQESWCFVTWYFRKANSELPVFRGMRATGRFAVPVLRRRSVSPLRSRAWNSWQRWERCKVCCHLGHQDGVKEYRLNH